MDLFKKEMQKEKGFDVIEFRNQRKHLRSLKQTGTSNKSRDETRKALAPGKRISKTGKIYWESRKSRSDIPGKKI